MKEQRDEEKGEGEKSSSPPQQRKEGRLKEQLSLSTTTLEEFAKSRNEYRIERGKTQSSLRTN